VINLLIGILLLAVVFILAVSTKWKGIITLTAIIVSCLISGSVAVNGLLGNTFETILSGTLLFGNVTVKVDALSSWFILTINFTIITGAIYGFGYLKSYRDRSTDITVHCIAYLIAHFSLVGICAVQNGFIFLL
jgi:formate hydrogenlyase subunit 3/multisubunit Na+/H+ antiporter MnhD subunit